MIKDGVCVDHFPKWGYTGTIKQDEWLIGESNRETLLELNSLRKEALIENTLSAYLLEIHNKSYEDFKNTYDKLHNVEFKGLERITYQYSEQEAFFYKGEHLFKIVGDCLSGYNVHVYWRG